MNVGSAHRTVAETQMNKISSCSHCIFTLFMNQHKKDGEVTTAEINLVDLPGSERVNKTGVVGQRYVLSFPCLWFLKKKCSNTDRIRLSVAFAFGFDVIQNGRIKKD